jgi:hypothetical protein
MGGGDAAESAGGEDRACFFGIVDASRDSGVVGELAPVKKKQKGQFPDVTLCHIMSHYVMLCHAIAD